MRRNFRVVPIWAHDCEKVDQKMLYTEVEAEAIKLVLRKNGVPARVERATTQFVEAVSS